MPTDIHLLVDTTMIVPLLLVTKHLIVIRLHITTPSSLLPGFDLLRLVESGEAYADVCIDQIILPVFVFGMQMPYMQIEFGLLNRSIAAIKACSTCF